MPASETGSSSVQGKIQVKSQGVAKNHLTEISSTSSTVAHGTSSSSRPSSNYISRSQQSIGPQKGTLYLCGSTNTLLFPALSISSAVSYFLVLNIYVGLI